MPIVRGATLEKWAELLTPEKKNISEMSKQRPKVQRLHIMPGHMIMILAHVNEKGYQGHNFVWGRVGDRMILVDFASSGYVVLGYCILIPSNMVQQPVEIQGCGL